MKAPFRGQFDRLFVVNSMSESVGKLVDDIHFSVPSTFGIVEGPMWSGKSAALRHHIGRSKKSSFGDVVDPSPRGEILSVEGCGTAKALALAVCRSLSPRAIDPTRATTRTAIAAAIGLASRFGGVLVLDDFDSIAKSGMTDQMREFLLDLGARARIVVAGREAVHSALAKADIPCRLPVTLSGWKPDWSETGHILRKFELGMGLSDPGFFANGSNAARFASFVPSGVVGAYHDILHIAWRQIEQEGLRRLDGSVLDAAIAEARESNLVLSDLIARKGGSPSRKLRPPSDGRLVVEGVVEAQVHDWDVPRSERHLLPSNGNWRIPVRVETSVEILRRSDLRHVATVKHRGEDFRREIKLHSDPQGRLYIINETEGSGIPEVRAAILDDARSLIGFNDEPEAQRGFPWGLKNREAAAKRMRLNVEALIPRIASTFALTDDGCLLEKAETPLWFASVAANGSFPVLDSGKRSLGDLARSFDHDDRDGILTFIDVVDKMTGRYRGEQPDFHGSVEETYAGALPRNSLARLVAELAQSARSSLSDVVIPAEIAEALDRLSEDSGVPDREKAHRILADLLKVEEFLLESGIPIERDYASEHSLITLARVRVAIAGGIALDPVDRSPYSQGEGPGLR